MNGATAPHLRLGAHIGQQNMPIADMRRTWQALDEPLDWLSVWDHLYEAPPAGGTIDHFEALTVLGAMAADTSHATLGCLVFYVGYRTPAVLAKAATTLDHLSGGRFELGLGGGWHEQEAVAYGYDFPGVATRLDMLDEATQIIRGLLTQPRTTFHGKHFRVEDASCLPAPVQARLPIIIGGVGEKRTLGIVARQADGWNAAYITPERFAELSAVLDQRCAEVGRDGSSIRRGINLTFDLATTTAAAERRKEELRAQWGPMFDRIAGGGLFGTPDEAIARVNEYVAAGATDVNIALRAPWNADALDAYVREVVPAVRAAAAR